MSSLSFRRRSDSGSRAHQRRLQFEPLEDRRMLAVLTVNSPLDNTISGNSLVTLREAIIAANTDATTDLGQLGSGADTIVFDSSVFAAPTTITLALGQLNITNALTIQGSGATNLTINGNQASRIFNIDNGNNAIHLAAELVGLTLTGGKVTGNGGAILSREILTVRDSVLTGNMANYGGGIHAQVFAGATTTIQDSRLTGNTAGFDGGGIRVLTYSGGAMTLRNSTLSGNSAGLDGGGVLSLTYAGASLTIQNSTLSGNSAGYRGGGISARTENGTTTIEYSTISGNFVGGGNDGGGGGVYSRNFGTTSIQNSTISGNSTSFDGGGVYSRNYGTTRILNSTVTGNTTDTDVNGSGSGGGIRSYIGTVAVENTILAGNSDNSGVAPNVQGGVAVRYSLIGNNAGSALAEAPVGSPDANGNLIGGSVFGAINPLLGSLAENGGPTRTHALLTGSPAIDAGDPAFVGPPNFDQRGAPFARVVNGGVNGARIDIGAYEVEASTPSLLGDYDHDDDVDADDYGVWRLNFGSTTNLAADGSGNGVVDAADYSVWRDQLGASTMAAAGTSAVAIPLGGGTDRVGVAEQYATPDGTAGDNGLEITAFSAAFAPSQSAPANRATASTQRPSFSTHVVAFALVERLSQQLFELSDLDGDIRRIDDLTNGWEPDIDVERLAIEGGLRSARDVETESVDSALEDLFRNP